MLSGYQYWRRITSTHQSSTFFYLFWLWLRTSQYLFGDGYCRFLTYRANGKIGSIFIVTKARKLARNWRGITVYRWFPFLASVFPFSSAYFRKVGKHAAMFLFQAPPFPPTAPLSSSGSQSAVLLPGIQVLGRAPVGVGEKDNKDN